MVIFCCDRCGLRVQHNSGVERAREAAIEKDFRSLPTNVTGNGVVDVCPSCWRLVSEAGEKGRVDAMVAMATPLPATR